MMKLHYIASKCFLIYVFMKFTLHFIFPLEYLSIQVVTSSRLS